MPEPLVQMENVSRVYSQSGHEFTAVKSASCRIVAGEKIAVIGNSGSGKSTLLHMIAGLEHPTAGKIAWPALGPPETLRPSHISVIFQTPALIPSLDVLENVSIPLLLRPGVDRDGEEARAVLDYFDLSSLAGKLPEELSGGQQQRAAVARGVVCQTPLILGDEPTGQLDQHGAADLLDKLLDLAARREAAIVIATHDPRVARRMVSLWRMDHGTLITEASV